jgi:hypothetical protein
MMRRIEMAVRNRRKELKPAGDTAATCLGGSRGYGFYMSDFIG